MDQDKVDIDQVVADKLKPNIAAEQEKLLCRLT